MVTATRTSTRMRGPRGSHKVKLKRSPSATPAGTATVNRCGSSSWPLPSHGSHRSLQTSPRPPQHAQVRGTCTSSDTIAPATAWLAEIAIRPARPEFAPSGLDVIAPEQFDRRARRWKIDRDFVGERAPIGALVGHERFERDARRVESSGAEHLAATIEARLQVVKNLPRV